jgi:hypothetical protein
MVGGGRRTSFAGPSRRIDSILKLNVTPRLLVAFFDEEGPFEGGLLHALPGNEPSSLTLEDLFAVTLLDVRVWPPGVRRLLFDDRIRAEIEDLLRYIPVCEDIWVGSVDFSDKGAAWKLWSLLQRRGDNIDDVTAGKLLARKRPRLITHHRQRGEWRGASPPWYPLGPLPCLHAEPC